MTFSLETLAVITALLYLILAIKQNIWCWAFALISTSIYLYVFYKANLYMESALQIFYIVMAIYGWQQWRGKSHINNNTNKTNLETSPKHLKISTWNTKQHLSAISLIVALALISSFLLDRFTNAALPLLDSLTTWGSIVATYMVARKIFENWHYWFVIDSLSIYLYISRDLTQTAILFGIYLVLIIIGYHTWKKDLPIQDAKR